MADADINEEAVTLAGFEARYVKIQADGVKALQANGDTLAVLKAARTLVDDADTARARDFADRVRKFIVAYAQFDIEKNVVALKQVIKAELPDLSSLKLAAKIIAKALNDLVVPALNNALAGLFKNLGALNDAVKIVLQLGLDDPDLAKKQKELEEALKKIDDAIKKLEEDAKKKAAEEDKKGGAAGAAAGGAAAGGGAKPGGKPAAGGG